MDRIGRRWREVCLAVLALMVLWAGCRRDTDPPAEPTTPQPPTVNMGVGDTTAMLVNVIDSTFNCGVNAWAMHQLPVPGSGASSIALGMYFYRSLVTHNTKFRMESGPLGDILFNGHSTTDTIRVAEDTVLRYVDMGATSFYHLHITTTYGCGVVGDLHAVEGRSYPYFYQAGIRPDSLAYVVAAPVYCYYSGHTYDAPAWDWINDSTQLRDTWAYLSDCYPQMDVGELVHVAFAKDVNGVMKYGWVSLRRVDGQRLWVGAVAIEP